MSRTVSAMKLNWRRQQSLDGQHYDDESVDGLLEKMSFQTVFEMVWYGI